MLRSGVPVRPADATAACSLERLPIGGDCDAPRWPTRRESARGQTRWLHWRYRASVQRLHRLLAATLMPLSFIEDRARFMVCPAGHRAYQGRTLLRVLVRKIRSLGGGGTPRG